MSTNPSSDYIAYICSLYNSSYDDRIENTAPPIAGGEDRTPGEDWVQGMTANAKRCRRWKERKATKILKSYSNRGLDYRYFVSYYRGKDKKKVKKNGDESYEEAEIDFIVEQDGILYPIEIKQSSNVSADMTSAFQVLDKIPEKKRGTGAVVCMCSMPGALRDNVVQIPYWYI